MKGYPLFRDRRDAGRRLAEKLLGYANQNPVVLGLPRGGVIVGYEIARTLNAPLDVIVARKLGVPTQPELGFGAIAPGGVVLVNQHLVDQLGLSQQDLDEVEHQERIEMERRLHHYRGDGLPEVRGCTAILVDDGLATGVTAEAAINAAKRLGATRVVLAVAVCSRDTADRLREMVDDLVCVFCPEPFIAVGIWYEQFEQNTDEEVIELLDRANDAIRIRHDKTHGN